MLAQICTKAIFIRSHMVKFIYSCQGGYKVLEYIRSVCLSGGTRKRDMTL